MLSLIKNTFKVLMRKRTVLATMIIIPTIITVGISFLMGSSNKYGIGLVNKDNGVISREVIKNLKDMDTISIVNLKEDEVDTSIISRSVELCIVIDENFTENILNGKNDNVKIKCIGESEIKANIENMINSSVNNLYKISLLANKDEEKFNEYLKTYKDNDIKYELNKVKTPKVSITQSIGFIIMLIFISSFYITRFIIDDEKSGTKERVLLGNVSKFKYYCSTFIVFFICSAITSILYYIICNVLQFDFKTDNSIYYLYVLLAVNFVSIGFNLALITISKSATVAANMSTLIVTIVCMISGLWWPFEIMPDYLQKIGTMMPPRWAMVAVENIQSGYTLEGLFPQIANLLICGIFFLIFTVVLSRKSSSH
ncbi:MAG: ABC transporter permease [Terrisporobacter sp.]|uniref:ABC transporter permease n=1 Tax=Terrisporobacter sp. TaxID=1965305 RepID=UPI002FC91F8B